MTSVLFMWSNLIWRVFLVFSVYEKCLFRVYLFYDKQILEIGTCCRELGLNNKDHNFWTWIGENIGSFLDKMLDQWSIISSFFPPYFSCSSGVSFLFTQQKKRLWKLPTSNTKLRENSNLFHNLLPSFRPQKLQR